MTANLCTESFDNEFESVKGLTWFPWIGKNYIDSKRRIMIVAESHYVNDKTTDEYIQKKELLNNRYCTREVVNECVIYNDWSNCMFDNLQCCLFGLSNKKNIKSDSLWNNLVFWNLIQRPMDYNGKERPRKDDFLQGWKVFLEIIRILKPTDCLFVGVTASNYFVRSMRENEVEYNPVEKIEVTHAYGRKYDLSIGFKLPIIAIQHTSHHFNREKWHGFLISFFNEPLRHLYDLAEDGLCCSGKVIRQNILKILHKNEGFKLYYVAGEKDIEFLECDKFGWLQTWITLGRLRDDKQLDALTIGCYGDGRLYVEIGIRKNPNDFLSATNNNKWWIYCCHKYFSISETVEYDVQNWLVQTKVYQSIFNERMHQL